MRISLYMRVATLLLCLYSLSFLSCSENDSSNRDTSEEDKTHQFIKMVDKLGREMNGDRNSTSIDKAMVRPEDRVICPAVVGEETDDVVAAQGGTSSRAVELVLVGRVKRLEDSKHGELFEAEIDRLIYGGYKGNKLKFSCCHTVGLHAHHVCTREIPENEELILAFYPDIFDPRAQFQLRYFLPISEEDAQIALGEVRLDCQTLSSSHIFVGSEWKTSAWYSSHSRFHHVKVVKVLSGYWIPEGLALTIENWRHPLIGGTPKLRPDPEIYFVNKCRINTYNYKVTCNLISRISADQESAVLSALGRRTLYPISIHEERNGIERRRDVIFLGDLDEAIELAGSHLEASAALGTNRLIREGEAATSKVVAAIERDLFGLVNDKGEALRRLRSLIGILPKLGEAGPEGKAVRLLNKYLSFLKSRPQSHKTKISRDDSDEVLSWFVSILDIDLVRKRYRDHVFKVRRRVRSVYGSLSDAEIERIVRSKRRNMRSCMNECQPGRRSRFGVFRVNFIIRPNGTVSKAAVSRSRKKDSCLTKCITKEIKQTNFPKPGDGKEVLVLHFRLAFR